jgi:hypothetical protein
MKRVRNNDCPETPSTSSPFVFVDVPCRHAGNLRRVDFWILREKCMNLHYERSRLREEAKTTMLLLEKRPQETARTLLSHDLVLSSLDGPGQGLTREALESILEKTTESDLVAQGKEIWRKRRAEETAHFNTRVLDLKQSILERTDSSWSASIVGFKRHLYQVYNDCDCFLCLDPASSLDYGLEDAGTRPCYLCAKEAPQEDYSSWLGARMCRDCCQRALDQGLCAFCWGLIDRADSTFPTCIGRGDFHRQRAATVHALGESSTIDF